MSMYGSTWWRTLGGRRPPPPKPKPVPPPSPVVAPAPPRRAFVMFGDTIPAWTFQSPRDLISHILLIAPAARWGVFLQWGKAMPYIEFEDAEIEVRCWGSCAQLDARSIRDELDAVRPSRAVAQIEGLTEFDVAAAMIADGVFSGVPLEAVISGWADFSPPALAGVTRTWIESYPIDQANQADLPRHLGDASNHGWPVTTPLVECRRDAIDWPLSRYVGVEQWRELAFWRDPIDWDALSEWLRSP